MIWQCLRRVIGFFLRDPAVFFKYIAVGGAAATLEFFLFTVLYEGLRLPLLVANCLAIAVCIVFSFTLQKRWTFRDQQAVRRQLPAYALMIAVAVILNNMLMYLFVAGWGWPAAIAKVVQIGLVFGWNFSISRLIVFSRKTTPIE